MPSTSKRPFSYATAFRRIEQTLEREGHAPAAMFELASDGHTSLFAQLVACIISIRTRDETSLPAARALLALADTPAAMVELSVAAIDRAIAASTFHEAKAEQIRAIARAIVEQHDGELPCNAEVLLSFKGVGPKCANLALGIACGQRRISVDIHVHRVTNRWGIIAARTPEASLAALEEVLPEKYWIDINRLLVPFGKHVCTGPLPRCSTCPVLDMCRQVGVTRHR